MKQHLLARAPIAFRAYYAIVIVVGAVLAFVFFPGIRLDSWPAMAWWVLFIVIADVSAIRLPGGRAYIAVSSSLDYAAIAVFGPAAAAAIEVLSTALSQGVVGRRPPHKVLFNLCLFVITIMAAGFVFDLLGGRQAGSLSRLILPLAACGATYFILNTGGVSTVIALSQRENAWRVWQRTYLWTLLHLVAFVPLGALIVVVFGVVGVAGVVLFLLPLLLARYTFKLYTDMLQVHMDTVGALTSAIDASDPFTRGHSDRVSRYATATARELGLSERRVQTIEYASMLHDMGKIAIQHTVLRKPSALSEDEWNQMKSHPETGAHIVADLHFLKGARDVVLYHHERVDGKGYPRGLAGEEIPLEARIVKVADAFDAMMSNRPYRRALGRDVATRELRNGVGTEFDGAVVEAFLRLVREGRIEITDANTRIPEGGEALEEAGAIV